jgi:DNA primase
MAFPPAFLDELRLRLPLSQVVGRQVRLQRRGREHSGLCPFHSEKTPSFTVSDDKGFYHCFGCGAHGDVIGFVMQNEGLSFPEAVERLAGEAGLELPRSTPEERERERHRGDLYDVVETAAAWFETQLRSGSGAGARAYLERRGLSEQAIGEFRLGYAPDRRGALRAAMNAKGIGDEALIAAGLIKQPEGEGEGEGEREPRDYFFDRLIFPITDRRGRVIAFGGRALGDSPAKYLNSPDSLLFHKGRVLFNLARARTALRQAAEPEVVIVEGYMDVIALAEHGFPAAVAPLGTALTPEQMIEVWRLTPEPIVCLDGDEAGLRAAYRAATRALPVLRPGHSLRFAVLPPGEDPDSLVRGQGAAALRAVLERAHPLDELLWLQASEVTPLDTPERRAGLRERLRATLRSIGDKDVRQAYALAMAERFDKSFGPARPEPRRRRGRERGGAPWNRVSSGLGTAALLRPPPEGLRLRGEQAVIAAVVNHPTLLLDHAEELASLTLTSRELDGVKAEILRFVTSQPDLDSEELKCHLSEAGFAGILGRILSSETYLYGDFARPELEVDAAREGWLGAVARISGLNRPQDAETLW